MRPLTLDDLLPLEEYAGRRREFFESLSRYVDRYRRIRIGPRLTLVFENRQTLWFRVQELLRIARLTEPARVRGELALYNRLLPGRDHLQAVLLIAIDDEAHWVDALATWQTLRGDELTLHLGKGAFPAILVTCRPEDRTLGASHWVKFHLDERARQLLADGRRRAYFAVRHDAYQYESLPLNDEVRQSLLEDLELSDRDD